MKTFVLLIINSILLFGCKSVQQQELPKTTTSELISHCPNTGTCTAERLKDKALLVTKDDFGREEVTIEEQKGSYVVHYKYERTKSPKGYMDDFYTEEIFMELPAKDFRETLEGTALQNVKLYFRRMCYCKDGSTGYQAITDGQLKIEHTKNQTDVELVFKSSFPHIIKDVHFSVR